MVGLAGPVKRLLAHTKKGRPVVEMGTAIQHNPTSDLGVVTTNCCQDLKLL